MRDELLNPLYNVLSASDYLLKETILNDLQRKFLHSIHTVSQDMQQLIVMTPPELLTIERAREMFSYETRELLASMIGYAEVLESEAEGKLDTTQHEQVRIIHTNATVLVNIIAEISE